MIESLGNRLREHLASWAHIRWRSKIWPLLTAVFALLSLKTLPFMWHVRLCRALLYQLVLRPSQLKPQDLFKPIVFKSFTPVSECDYNAHKSNSTYFTDLDMARTHLVTALLRNGLENLGRRPGESGSSFSFKTTSRAAGHKESRDGKATGSGKPATPAGDGRRLTEQEWWEQASQPGALLIALGSVSCHFHREIAPFQRYEIWTRLLAWDQKWLYIVSHFVEANAFEPVQDGDDRKERHPVPGDTQSLKRKIFASSIAKYVVKKGRLTIPPEVVLDRSSMLPARPPGTPILADWRAVANVTALDQANVLQHQTSGVDSDDREWTLIEARRKSGMEFAGTFDSLDKLKDVFDLGGKAVLGVFPDLAL